MDLEATLNQLADPLLRYSLARCGDRELAEDITQEALAALLRRWRKQGPPRSAFAFAFAIARRRAARRLWRRRLSSPFGEAERILDPAADPERHTESRQRLRKTVAAIHTLGRGEREALLLAVVANLGNAEAARLQGISLSAQKMRLHRARKRLLEIVEDETP
jgi:RNA polymerase sigma-70 factor (ECF subfamily)